MTNDKDGACPCWGTDKEVEQLRAELEAAQAALRTAQDDYSANDQRWRDAWNRQGGELGAQLSASRKENAQLTAALIRIAQFPIHSEPVGGAYAMSDVAETALKGNSTTLRELLKPTMELLDWLRTRFLAETTNKVIKDELTRLRELCREKGTDAKRIH